MTTVELVTLGIAIYGAVVATVSAVRQVLVDRARLAVSLSTVIPTYDGGLGPTCIQISVVNRGQRQTVVDWISIELSDRRTLALADASGSTMPSRLAQGEKASSQATYAHVASALLRSGLTTPVRVRGFCKDSEGRTFYSKAWVVDPAEWARM